MAEVLEETEQERLDRIAREEALLLEQEAMASQLPQGAIPAENVGFTNGLDGQIQIDLPEGFAPTFNRQMIGDERYQQEVARARAGSGFIAGYGDTQTYDPAIAEAFQRREQDKLAAQAERFMGVQGYQESIRNGNTPAEALALWGSKMFRGDPKGLVNLATRRGPLPQIQPEVVNVGGVKMYRTGPNSFAQARPEVAAKAPPETVAGQKILTGQITDARNALARAEKTAAAERDTDSVNAALRARSKLRGLEENYLRGSTNWMGAAKAPTETAPAVTADSIREQFKAGKLSREEAKKALNALGFE